MKHSLVLTGKNTNSSHFFKENHGLFCFGNNKNGQLGVGESKFIEICQPVSFFNKCKIKQVYTGENHSLVITGKLFLNF